MYESLKGKRLLIIGSDAGNINIINVAREMGVYTVVTDGITDYKNAPAKRAADEAWNIDYSKTEEVAKKCKESGIDGVFAGYSEYRVLAACRIANAIGTPFYATEEQIQLTRNKRTFKDYCIKYDIPIPKDYCFKNKPTAEERAKIEYPVIVKPADYAGRKGISVCFKEEQLEPALDYAMSKSESRTIIVEDFLDGIEFSSIYTLKNGEISLSAVDEKYITDDQEIKTGLCEFLISPAGCYERYLKELDGKMRSFMKGIHAKNGVIFFQGIVTQKQFYVFEMGYRINGNNDFQIIEKFNGINYLKMSIAHSLTGDMCDDINKDNPCYPKITGTMIFYVHKGTIGKLEYSPICSHPQIHDLDVRCKIGSSYVDDGSTGQCIMKMKVTADSMEQMAELVKFIQKNVIVEDENGENMLFKPFDADVLLK